ncbi:hypothetical protein AMK23_34340 [Streptomyces sp. CB02130]|uniref:hypothetical protein n=1 Tax=Streptomyces sp. CB02130 TaxID=1703934 RepID=UPI00093F5525|nr:hypothetical protein [Streptomyces sp. CB02130]OKJ19376.1 hypothetical protein AMK23_34340 [Streptomyces sp. CB02130]
MQILVPDDPMFMTRFLEVEEPLFHSLYYLHRAKLPEDQAEKVSRAYDAWGDILRAIPGHLTWHTHKTFELAEYSRRKSKGYSLYGPKGEQLISMYVIEVSVENLSSLTECLRLFELAELELRSPLAEALAEIREPDQDRELVDNYKRVLTALQLPAPRALVAELLGAAPEVSLNGALYAEYTDYRDKFCHALSTGDWWMYTMHRSLYL